GRGPSPLPRSRFFQTVSGAPRFVRTGQETQPGAGDVVGIELDADPAAPELLGDPAGDVAAGEGVEDELPRLGQEANEEFRYAGHEAGRVNGQARGPAAVDVGIVGAGVRDGEQ